MRSSVRLIELIPFCLLPNLKESAASDSNRNVEHGNLVMENTTDLPVSEKTTTTKYPRKKLEKMRKNYHHSRSLQPDYQDPQSNPTPFRTIEQYYKRRLWEPDYNLAFGHHSIPPPSTTTTTTSPMKVEWSTPHQAQSIQAHIHPLPSNSSQPSIIKPCELCHPQSSPDRIFCTFPKQYPGLIYLPSYLCQHQQAELVEDCLTNGLRKPNVTNIDTHWEMPHQPGLYDLYRLWLNNENSQNQSEDQDQELDTQFILQPKPVPESSVQQSSQTDPKKPPQQKSRRQKVDFEPINAHNFLVARNDRPKEDQVSAKAGMPIHIRDLWMNGKLRWCTIGWQYHWPTKTYHFERDPTPISDLVQSTCKNLINRVVPWDVIDSEFQATEKSINDCEKESSSVDWKTNYKPEAGVINFYQYRDALTAHIDHSEVTTDTPLVSLSVGQACIFLIAASREEEPLAIKLESGDALIMAGPSRRFFHGVPRIIEHSLPPWTDGCLSTGPSPPPWARWFHNGGRINLNVRQVF
ncbi:hypothetical protein PGT21_022364 [Puccinia graminis f. sp. tritici]|uniref:Fe2OG dioxygenase domain-containing protein n=1 Tax=Puccinia graminis f. sp. tritici TaxID=56615 RepID=A0A5B0MBN0_PUCGR|nr:hypothetical protein PGT21_022364 [Puccinia graminis f. sp. tritici]